MTTTLRALSCDTELLERLNGAPLEATVHSVFDRVVNLNDAGRLYTVAAAGVDNAPATLVLDIPSCQALQLKVGDRVRNRRERLLLPGGRMVDLRRAQRWQPGLASLPMPASSLCWLTNFLAAEGVPGGARPDPDGGELATTVSRLLTAALAELLAAAQRGAVDEIAAGAHRLLGLGTGLTPSGDDALLGVALVAAMPGSTLAPLTPLLHNVFEVGAPFTNAISLAALQQAVRGRTRQSVIALLAAMSGGDDEDELNRLGRAVTAIGHTSGTDILVGMCAALILESEMRGER